jgi:hypothetical protein
MTAENHRVLVVDRETSTRVLSQRTFEQVLRLAVSDAGIAYVNGFGDEFWGLYRLEDGHSERVSEDAHATADNDDSRLAEVTQDLLTIRPIRPGSGVCEPLFALSLPFLGTARYGTAVFLGRRSLVVRTDTHTLAGIKLPDGLQSCEGKAVAFADCVKAY